MSSSDTKKKIEYIGSFPFLLTLHAIFLLAYAIIMPSFEGADEPEHLRYIEAVYKGEKVHPVDPSDPRRFGIEVYQPPLYYYFAAYVAKPFPVVFPENLSINPHKTRHAPYLVHDGIGEIFPFDSVHSTLRFFRLLSVLFGIISFIMFGRILFLIMPQNPDGRAIFLLLAALWPNNLQISSVVSNDSLCYLLSMAMVLTTLIIIKTSRPSWKHGIALGFIVALGILTKMTTMIVVAALFPIIVFDLVMDRSRWKDYLRLISAVLLPAILIAGPYIVFNIISYGSPTGENLLRILTPSFARPSPLPLSEVLAAMGSMLPDRFLADLCWQSFTLPVISSQLFVLWLSFNLLMALRVLTIKSSKSNRHEILFVAMIMSFFLFMFIALYRIFVDWVGMQVRHVWNLWALTLLAPYFAVKDLKVLKSVNKKPILMITLTGLTPLFVLINFLVIYNFILIYQPTERISKPDLDYATFIDVYADNIERSWAYLETSGSKDITAYRDYFQKRDWKRALFHAHSALEKGANKEESLLTYTQALRALKQKEEALNPHHGESLRKH